MMRSLLLLGLAVVGFSDPNRLPQDDTLRYAKFCLDQLGQLNDVQLAMTVDLVQACAIRAEGGGAMVIPDQKLSAAALGQAGKELVPVGQLWLRKWTPALQGKVVPDDKLRIVTINIENKNRPMPLFFLGARQIQGKMELVVFAKDAEPFLVLPLRKVASKQELPLAVAWDRGAKDIDDLTLTIVGQYQAVLTIARSGK